MKLLSCSSCARHVRVDAASCPFCGAAVVAPPEAAPTRKRVSRAAMVAGAAVVAVACSSTSTVALYGAPAGDAGPPGDAATSDAGDGAINAMYGGPPDSGKMDAGSDAPVAAYGGPPVDAGGD